MSLKILYCDPGLQSSLGHHANTARLLSRCLRSSGCEVEIAAVKDIENSLAHELNARRVFAIYCYFRSNLDPIAGWMSDFLGFSSITCNELSSFAPDGSLIYWNSAQPTQFHALLSYLHRFPNSRAMVEFGTAPGLDTSIDAQTGAVRGAYRHPFVDPTSLLWRYCSYLLDERIKARTTICTYDKKSSDLYREVLNFPVQTFPIPRDAHADPRPRGQKSILTISFLGHQRRGDKGYELVPDLLRQLLISCPTLNRPVRFLIHNGDPDGRWVHEIQVQVRQLAQENPDRIIIDERTADAQIWQQLLDQSDLIVLPYRPDRFHASYSAVCCEAVANGIPLVVPAATSLSTICQEFGGCISFDAWEAAKIAQKVLAAINGFEQLAAKSHAGVAKWRCVHGADKTARAIIERLS